MSDLITILRGAKKHVMTGVSYMIPFAVAGGVTLAVCVMLGGQNAVPSEGVLGLIAQVGIAGLTLMVPVLAGYIAYSIADRAGIAPGFIGGYIANTIGAGFLGGLFAGLLAGILAFYLKRVKVPAAMSSVVSIFIIPLVDTLLVCCVMLFVVGTPIAAMMSALTDWLNNMGTGNAVLLGIILGAMDCTDMGGPIGKVAYTFGVTMVGTIEASTGLPSFSAMQVMAAVGASCAIPPLACGLSTLLFRDRYTDDEKEAGKAALVMGVVSISEGAIPFAANSPLRTIPQLMVAGGLGGALAMLLGAGNPAPWGGLIVAPIVTNPFGYCLAIAAGAVVGALLMGISRKAIAAKTEMVGEDDDDDLDLDIEIG
ncbi:PTS fructose-like transporter subunit EIIC [Coriobacteriales bacterium OH1046]|nr:PTS fructose-like transporter subunit EIIC [Coriobacteriales bacterium OH1046]